MGIYLALLYPLQQVIRQSLKANVKIIDKKTLISVKYNEGLIVLSRVFFEIIWAQLILQMATA